MSFVIVGLGNPGKEYEKTRHNAGRMVVEKLAKEEGFPEFVLNKKAEALVSVGTVGGKKVTLVLPETYMNKSGKSIPAFVKSVKAAKTMLVVQDELDVPLGAMKLVFGRNSGGHKGVESVMRAIKTKDFARLRIGISGQGKKNQAKKPSSDEKVNRHVVGKFKPAEEAAVKKAVKKGVDVARRFVAEGFENAQLVANTR